MLQSTGISPKLTNKLNTLWANTNHDINVTLDLMDMACTILPYEDSWLRESLLNGLQPTILEWPTHVLEYTARQIEGAPQPELLDPAPRIQYVTQYFEEYMSYIPEASIALTIDYHDDIITDPYWLETSVFNVIRNAQKIVTGRDRNSKLIIPKPHIHVLLGKDSQGNTIVTISDNGGGFPQHLLDEETITTEDGSTKTIQKALKRGETVRGTGLGLDIAYQNMMDSHGEIQLSNNEEGAVATLRFPTLTP